MCQLNILYFPQKELSRLSIHQHNMLIIIKATAYELPYIPIRQSGSQVTDYSPYFKIPILSKADINMCSSGLVYLHIHRYFTARADAKQMFSFVNRALNLINCARARALACCIAKISELHGQQDQTFENFRAVGLPAMDTTSKTSDPYVKVKVNGEKLFKTQVTFIF